ncbi:hypothetical protein IE4872_CH03816 [Rhizobium gallicum]|uniref:Uncharacterized protein n=1 Tax=Rhizobium gallicum TaxID=56730 RepID=A0A1L5NNC1_9HYPH|nr:hypothetical protein IE4872_CH03816 [Rhizobium gallicum]
MQWNSSAWSHQSRILLPGPLTVNGLPNSVAGTTLRLKPVQATNSPARVKEYTTALGDHIVDCF